MTDEEKVTVLVFPGKCAARSLGAVDWELSPVGGERRVGKRRSLVFEAGSQVVREEVREREFEVDAFDAVVSDPDLLEERLVEGASDFFGGSCVGLEAVGGEGERLVEVAFDLVEPQGAGVEDPLCVGFLGGDACLLFSEEVEGDGVGVVSVEELLAFVVQLGESPLLAVGLFAVEVPSDLDVVGHVLTDLVETTRVESDDLVVVDDLVFDPVDRQIALGAAVAALPPEAEGVPVGAAVAFGVGDGEP